MPVDTSKIPEIIKLIEKQYEAGNIHTGNEVQSVPRIPFPSYELNVATGGGVPIGRISRFWGGYSSGKTLNSLNVIKNAQNLHLIAEQMLDSKYDAVKARGQQLLDLFPEGLTCAYYNIEKVYDKEFAAKVGVDTDKLLIIEGSRLEETGSKVEASLGAIHLHVLDSAAAAVSVDELASDIEDWHRAIKARAWSKVLDHLQEHLDPNENVIIFLDQMRVNQQTGGEMAPGGSKLEHSSSLTLHLKRGKWLFRRDGVLKPEAEQSPNTLSGKAEADGFEINAFVAKSRVGRPFRRALLQVDFDKMGFDLDYELAKMAPYFGVVEQNGAWYTLPDGSKVNGKKGLRDALAENIELKQTVQDTIESVICENP
jgi:recombination protein RecA